MKTLWTPSIERIAASALVSYIGEVEKQLGISFEGYQELHRWSISDRSAFWKSLFPFFNITYEGDFTKAYTEDSWLKYSWFPDVSLNFAENLLCRGKSDAKAIHYLHESGFQRTLTYGQLSEEMAALQQTLRDYIDVGDVAAAYMPNVPETVISMLATAGLGGIFTSCSCDFGLSGVLDRFGQTKPKVLIAAESYTYKGKTFDLVPTVRQIQQAIPSIEKVIFVELNRGWKELPKTQKEPIFKRLPFSSPLYIMYSSGTTGKPKCIVHTAGGVLLQHVKELGLHTNYNSGKSLFFFTTCSWMMWNWLVSGLFFGGKIILYEGAPAHPSYQEYMLRLDELDIDIFGLSPKFLRGLELSGWKNDLRLENLETILSTGAPLLPEQYDFVYEKVKDDVQLVSLSGGTDILGCFFLGNPILPVMKGELQCIGLGMDAIAVDENGEPLIDREGELVCRKPFPSMPCGFWNDPEQQKFEKSYFSRFPGWWHHGDYIRISEEGTVRIFGRSDTTLNPGGVRIGTSEIYRQIEGLEYISDSVCVAKGDEIILFVKMTDGFTLTKDKIEEIGKVIKEGTTPRHVPSQMIAVPGIPYTFSGKKMEALVSKLVNGNAVDNLDAVSNPECLLAFMPEKIISR